jgi:hypothetical protein
MKLFLFILFTFFTLHSNSSSLTTNKEIVVLVPGFFNSLTAEYFSNDIIQTFQKRGLKVYVATGLNPIGTVEDNGERLMRILQHIQIIESKQIEFNVVAHSAGGLYTLYVAHKQKFKIKNLITVSTPFRGVEFIQKWIENSLLFDSLTRLAHLEGLRQLTPKGVSQFIESVRVPDTMKIIAFGGYQEKSSDIWNARYLSLPFRVTEKYITGPSDGIVSFNSATSIGNIKTISNSPAIQLVDKKYRINLDHWEQVLNGYSFLILGIRNPGLIRDEQVRFYSGIADYLLVLL